MMDGHGNACFNIEYWITLMEAFSASRIFFTNDFFLELTYRHRKQIKANENATVQTRAIATALQALNSVGEKDKKMS